MATAPAGSPYLWTLAPLDAVVEASIATLAGHLATRGCPAIIARLLASRNILTPAAAEAFFSSSLDELHDPLQMLGMAAAVNRIQQAVALNQPILIYGDYDVDGTTATVLLKTAIERIAPKDTPAQVTFHVPHRIREGYGMQTNILGQAATAGVQLVISVDTGIRAFAAADEAKLLGLDLIVTDHHLPDDVAGIPEALAVVNPAQPGCPYPFKSLCGAAVAFKLSHALLAAAATTPDQQQRLRSVILPSFLKLVAIATIADSVPLVGENRTIATIGLRELRNPVQPGLRALMHIAKLPLDRAPSATEVGFRIAPRINAAGRMDIADDVVELFLTRDPQRAQHLAEKLDRLNQDRRDTEATALHAIEQHLEVLRDPTGELPADCIILSDPAWHRGVLGILASRVVDRTGRPALVLTQENGDANGDAHGSGRSVQGFHLLDALTAVDTPALFSRFGGHAHAVGFSLPTASVEALRTRMSLHATATLTLEALRPEWHIDAELLLDQITPSLWDWLERCGPFGNANPEPLFLSRAVPISAPIRFIKEKHICIELRQSAATTLSGLGWSRRIDWPTRCRDLNLGPGTLIDIVYRIQQNPTPKYRGLQLELVDLKLSEPPL